MTPKSNMDNIAAKLAEIDWAFKDVKTEPLHSIHPYPAKFIPQIPEALIDILHPDKSGYILDPFCGSGVTLSVAQEKGYNAIGVDLNPIAVLNTKVKTSSLPDDFMKVCNEIVSNCEQRQFPLKEKVFPNIDHWFQKEIQYALAILKEEIDNHTEYNGYDALNFCLSSIIVKVSNQDSDTRYAFRDKGRKKTDVLRYFIQSAKKLFQNRITRKTDIQVYNYNALKIGDIIPNNISAVITSPPYPCAYEYWLYHKFRMYWLNYNPIEVRSEEIGARFSYFKKKEYEGYDFAEQMQQLLVVLYDKCSKGATLSFIIGRSKIHGTIYKNDEIIVDIAEQIGFSHITTIARNMNDSKKSFNLAHARINIEYIIVLMK